MHPSVNQFWRRVSFVQVFCLSLIGLFILNGLASGQGVSPSTPAKEYIRLNGRVIAIESANSSLPPSLFIDAPSSFPISGQYEIWGWAIDNTTRVETAITQVEVYIDGAKIGNATYGLSRPDVCSVYPNRVGCPNVGWSFVFNSTSYANGLHILRVVASDSDNPSHQEFDVKTIHISN